MLVHLSNTKSGSFSGSHPGQEGSPQLRPEKLCNSRGGQLKHCQKNRILMSEAVSRLTRSADQLERELAAIEREIARVRVRLMKLCDSPLDSKRTVIAACSQLALEHSHRGTKCQVTSITSHGWKRGPHRLSHMVLNRAPTGRSGHSSEGQRWKDSLRLNRW